MLCSNILTDFFDTRFEIGEEHGEHADMFCSNILADSFATRFLGEIDGEPGEHEHADVMIATDGGEPNSGGEQQMPAAGGFCGVVTRQPIL